MKVRATGIEPRAFFIFKMSYDNDNTKYAQENVEKFDDFEVYTPIATI